MDFLACRVGCSLIRQLSSTSRCSIGFFEVFSFSPTAISYEGGTISVTDSSVGVKISKWWMEPKSAASLLRHLLENVWGVFTTSSSPEQVSSVSFFLESQNVRKIRSSPPIAITTGPAISQLLCEATWPTTVNEQPTKTQISGARRMSRQLVCWFRGLFVSPVVVAMLVEVSVPVSDVSMTATNGGTDTN